MALATISGDLGVSTTEGTWVITAYAVARARPAGDAVDPAVVHHVRDAAWNEGRAMTLDAAVRFALELAEAFDSESVARGSTTEALDRLDAERDNLLHALAWCSREADATATGLRLAAALRHFWGARGLLGAGLAATRLALDRAEALAGDRYRCMALGAASQMLNWMGRAAEAETLNLELLALGEAIAFAPAIAVARVQQGYYAADRHEWGAAELCFEGALQAARSMGSLSHECSALAGLADILSYQSRMDEASARLDELLALRRGAGNGYNLATALRRCAVDSLSRGDTARARALLTEAQPLVRGAGSLAMTWGWCRLVGSLAARHGRWAVMVRLLASATRFRTENSLRLDDYELRHERGEIEDARAALGDAAYAQALGGRHVTDRQRRTGACGR